MLLDSIIGKLGLLFSGSDIPEYLALRSYVGTAEMERLRRIATHRDYYDGVNMYPYLGADGEEQPFVDLCYEVVNKGVAWLNPKAPSFSFRDETQPILGPIAEGIIAASGGDAFFEDVFSHGAITGDVILHPMFDPSLGENGGVRIVRMDTGRTFLEYGRVGMRRVLRQVMFIWDDVKPNTDKHSFIMEVWTDDEVRVYPAGLPLFARGVAEESLKGAYGVDPSGAPYSSYKNPYGFLPFVHIQNLPRESVYGRSDVQSLWRIAREINEQLLNYKDNVDYHSNPITLLFGLSANKIEKGGGKVWGNLPKDSKVENLEVTQTFPMVTQFLTMLNEFGGVGTIPHHLMGIKDPVKADVSEVAMKLSYMPLIELTQRKRIQYGHGLKAAMEMALQILDQKLETNLSVLNAPDANLLLALNSQKLIPEDKAGALAKAKEIPFYNVDVVFHERLPRNRTVELADIDLELRMKMESLRGGLVRLGVVDPDKKLKEIEDTAVLLGRLMMLQNAAAGVPTLPPPSADAQSNPNLIEATTGQSAARTATQRAVKGKAGI